MTAEILFISDLHLDQNRPDISANFLSFIKTRALKARVLYILGDLFEVWSGDDDPAEEFSEIFNAMKEFSTSGDIYFLHGNRDFLVRQQLAQKAGFKILSSPFIIESGLQRIALLHGDELCTEDLEYQKFRKQVRSHQWQHDFLAKPLSERLSITKGLRKQSKTNMSAKTAEMMDVSQQAVINTFDQLKVNTIIHGHTHQPGIHSLDQDRFRYVLGDWNPDPSFISLSEGKLRLIDSRV